MSDGSPQDEHKRSVATSFAAGVAGAAAERDFDSGYVEAKAGAGDPAENNRAESHEVDELQEGPEVEEEPYEYEDSEGGASEDESDGEGIFLADGDAGVGDAVSIRKALRKYPTVGAFVKLHSGLVRVTEADEPDASWIGALPPADILSIERSIRLLAYLMKLFEEPPAPPLAVFHLRTQPLSKVLSTCSWADLGDLVLLADYLSLPKTLVLRISQQRAAMPQLGRSCDAGDPPLLPALREADCLSSVLDAELLGIEGQLKKFGHECATTERERLALLRGLCGDPLGDPAGEVRTCGRISCAKYFPVFCPHHSSEHRLHPDVVWYAVGQVISKCTRPIGVSDACKWDTLPTAIAAGLGHRAELFTLLADGWWVDTKLVHDTASSNDMPLIRAMCDVTGCRFQHDLLTHVAVAVAAARNGCEETLRVVAAREKVPPETFSKAATAGRLACAHCKERHTPVTAAGSRCTGGASHLWHIYEWS